MAVTRSEVAERYAAALFDLSRDEGSLAAVESDLRALSQALDESVDLQRVVTSPVFEAHEKAAAMDAILSGAGAQSTTRNFVGVLSRNRRLSQLRAVITSFLAMAADFRGEISASAISARPLTDSQLSNLRQQIEASVGKTVNLETSVDESLLGGLIVKVGSKMIDSSIRTKLNRLQQSLKEA